MRKLLLLLSLKLLLGWQLLFAQQVTPFGIAEGLSSNFVFDVHQSEKGFLYLGLHEGLNRYDGYTVEHFKHNPFDPYSIKKGLVRAIAEDKRGYIWLSMGMGNKDAGFIEVFNPQTQQFYHLGQVAKWLNVNKRIGIKEIIADGNGDIWLLGGTSELFKVDLPTDFTLEDKPASINSFEVHQIQIPDKGNKSNGVINALLDTQDNLWALGANGTVVWIDKKTLQTETVFQDKSKIKIDKDTPFFEDVDGMIKFRAGKQWYQIKNRQVESIPVNSWFQKAVFWGIDKAQNYVYSILDDKRKQIDFYQSPIASLTAEQPIYQHFYTLPKFIGTRLFIDHAGIFWVKDRFGLNKVNPNAKKFQHILNGKSVHQLLVNSKGIIFHQNNSRVIPNLSDSTKAYVPISSVYPQLDFPIQSILIDQNDQIFGVKKALSFITKLKTDKHRFLYFHFDPATNAFQEFGFTQYPDFGKVPVGTIDHKNRIWLANNTKGIFLFDLIKKELTPFQDKNFYLPPNLNLIYRDFFVDQNNQLWIATDAGIIRTNSNEFPQHPPQWERIANDPTNNNSLNSNTILCFLEDSFEPYKYIWVGTGGGGLNRLNKETGFCRHFTTENSDIPDDNVLQMQTDSLGRIWMSTKRGLSSFDPPTETFVNYTPDDGLQGFEFNFSSLKLPSGTLLFGGFDGLTVFNPNDEIFQDKSIPFTNKIQITQLYVNNKKVGVHAPTKTNDIQLSKAIEYMESISLAHHENNIRLHFSTTDLTNPRKNRFQYRLTKRNIFGIGKKAKWIDLAAENKVAFNNLSPATYLFEIKGANHEGIWNEMPTTLTITIHPPWWQSLWAYFLYFLTFLGIIYAIYKNQIHRAKLANDLVYEQKETERLAELDRIKTDFFSNITHEFRTPLTLILEPLRQVLKKDLNGEIAKSLQLAKNNSEKLLQLVNQLLDISKLEAGKMELDLRKGNVREVIQPIVDSFKILATRKGLALEMTVAQNINDFYFDKKHLEKVVYNLLANAVKFTSVGSIQLAVGSSRYAVGSMQSALTREKDMPNLPDDIQTGLAYLNITLKDTGIGIPQNQIAHIFERFYQADSSSTRKGEGTGIGLALTKELIELMDGTIEVNSKIGQGSTFTVQLPMWQSAVGSSQSAVGSSSLTRNQVYLDSSGQPTTGNRQPTTDNNQTIEPSNHLLLLIEDNTELRHFLKISLQKDYKILEAENGEVGVHLAKKHLPDLIISDLMMPEKDGFEVVEDLKKDIKTSHIPIILLTAKTAIDSKLKGLRGGADDYLTKPFNTDELQVRITNLIVIREQLQAKFSKTLTQSIGDTASESLSKIDKDFLENLQKLMEENLENELLSVEILAQKVFMSRTHLFRKVKALTNLTPTEFIRNYRLDRALEILKKKEHNVIQVSMLVGFNSEKYFSRRFKERFGRSPSEV